MMEKAEVFSRGDSRRRRRLSFANESKLSMFCLNDGVQCARLFSKQDRRDFEILLIMEYD